MRCPQRRAAARSYDFGSRFALVVATSQATVFPAIPMGHANSVNVCLVLLTLPSGGSAELAVLASNDDENYTLLASMNFNTVGPHCLAVTQIAFAHVRVGVKAQGISGRLTGGVSAQTGNN